MTRTNWEKIKIPRRPLLLPGGSSLHDLVLRARSDVSILCSSPAQHWLFRVSKPMKKTPRFRPADVFNLVWSCRYLWGRVFFCCAFAAGWVGGWVGGTLSLRLPFAVGACLPSIPRAVSGGQQAAGNARFRGCFFFFLHFVNP